MVKSPHGQARRSPSAWGSRACPGAKSSRASSQTRRKLTGPGGGGGLADQQPEIHVWPTSLGVRQQGFYVILCASWRKGRKCQPGGFKYWNGTMDCHPQFQRLVTSYRFDLSTVRLIAGRHISRARGMCPRVRSTPLVEANVNAYSQASSRLLLHWDDRGLYEEPQLPSVQRLVLSARHLFLQVKHVEPTARWSGCFWAGSLSAENVQPAFGFPRHDAPRSITQWIPVSRVGRQPCFGVLQRSFPLLQANAYSFPGNHQQSFRSRFAP